LEEAGEGSGVVCELDQDGGFSARDLVEVLDGEACGGDGADFAFGELGFFDGGGGSAVGA